MRCTVRANLTEHKAMEFTSGAREGSFVAISSHARPECAVCVCVVDGLVDGLQPGQFAVPPPPRVQIVHLFQFVGAR